MVDGACILVVEDDGDLREHIRLAAENRSYRVLSAGNGLEARKLLEEDCHPDLVLLDINMPGLDGFGFCRWLREGFPRLPVIFLSARAEEYDKIVALEIGGDDYLTKPFSMKELFARIGVCLRRVRVFAGEQEAGRTAACLAVGNLKMDTEQWTCRFSGKNVLLTISEFRILRKLLENPGQVIQRRRLAEAAFPEDSYNLGRSIDVHICRIRRKLQCIDPGFDAIETVYQLGYRWKS